MKLVAVVIGGALALSARPAFAFHSGGAGECDGCHTMHAKQDGSPPGPGLTQGNDASSTCLLCHGGTTQANEQVFSTNVLAGLPPANYTPGGDFAWLTKSYYWTTPQGLANSPGERHGHNVVATDFGLAPDNTNATAPGGTFPSNKLSCTSCHDPHGRYRLRDDGTISTSGKPIFGSGSNGESQSFLQPTKDQSVGVYRLLGGVGYRQSLAANIGVTFSNPPPIALSPTLYNKRETLTDVRIAYGTGMSEWCANCHGTMHDPSGISPSTFKHPVGMSAKLNLGGEMAIYNQYLKSGSLTGTHLTSYTSMVPYEEGTADRTALAPHARSDGTFTTGPQSGLEQVMCLSCHRAHASGWDHALRWNMHDMNLDTGFIVADGAWPGIDSLGTAGQPQTAQGRTQLETRGAMYDRSPSVYAKFQRTLCNKCHGQG